MMQVRTILVTSVLTLLVLGGCEKSTNAAPTAGVTAAPTAGVTAASTAKVLLNLPKNAFGFVDLSVEQLAESMERKNFTLVNVHVPDEGNLPNTDRSIAYDQIMTKLDQLPAKDAPIVLYCRSGGMSTQAAAALAAAGYTQVYELDGGFNAWKASGRKLLNQ